MSRRRSVPRFPLALLVLLAMASATVAQITSIASVDSGGGLGNRNSLQPTLSHDGRYVAFASDASNLVGGDTNGRRDVFLHDRLSGLTERVSVGAGGVEGDDTSESPSISWDARRIAFASRASNLVGGDTNGVLDVFLRDLASGTTTRLSVDSSGGQGDGDSWDPALSADGERVVFLSAADNLVAGDGNGADDVFLHDLQTGRTVRVSVDSSQNEANGSSQYPVISGDGRRVAFESLASDLVPGDTNGVRDVFVHDLVTGETIRVSVDSSGQQANDYCYDPALSWDGRLVAFATLATNLVPADTNGEFDVFLHDLATHTTSRISVTAQGDQADLGSDYPTFSADGRFFSFVSNATNLVAGDTNQVADVFRRDLWTGEVLRTSIDSFGTEANSASSDPTLSADGRCTAFRTRASNLIGGDTNHVSDVFCHLPLALIFHGPAAAGQTVSFTVAPANASRTGDLALVLLSCSGIGATTLPGGEIIYLTFDACTLLGLAHFSAFSATVNASGSATTPGIVFPPNVPPGLSIDAASVLFGAVSRRPVAVCGPIAFTTQ